MKEIIIESKKFGIHTLIVDDEDYEETMKFKWSLKEGQNTFYAHRKQKKNEPKPKSEVKLHRVVMRVTDPKRIIDHIDGNGLNNQKSNLRVCNDGENKRNIMVDCDQTRNSSSLYKGVHWNKNNKRWMSRIQLNGRTINLGSFTSEIAACRMYDISAIKYFGKYACLNFPIEDYYAENLSKIELEINNSKKVSKPKASVHVGISHDRYWRARFGSTYIGSFRTENDAFEARNKYIEGLE